MNCRMTAAFIQKFKDKPDKNFVSGVNDAFDYIEANMLRMGFVALVPVLKDRRERCIDNINHKQGNADYHLGFLAVLDHCLKEH